MEYLYLQSSFSYYDERRQKQTQPKTHQKIHGKTQRWTESMCCVVASEYSSYILQFPFTFNIIISFLVYHATRCLFFIVFLFDDLGWMVHCTHFVFAKELQQGFWTWARRHIYWEALRDAVVWICWYASPLYGLSVWVWWLSSKTIGINKKNKRIVGIINKYRFHSVVLFLAWNRNKLLYPIGGIKKNSYGRNTDYIFS